MLASNTLALIGSFGLKVSKNSPSRKPEPLMMQAEDLAASKIVSRMSKPGSIISARSLARPSTFFLFSRGNADKSCENT
ncbi:hypothetical protein D3C85_1122910 [compost metagenome]